MDNPCAMREEHQVGIEALLSATGLLRRVRLAHPTAGLLEAADLQWWWRSPRTTDSVPQLFWFDTQGHPQAAVIATDWGDAVALDAIVMPDARADEIALIIERGLAHARALGFGSVDVVVDRADTPMRDLLSTHGFSMADSASLDVVCAWLAAGARPSIDPLPEGYRLCSRLDLAPQPHHMIGRNGPDIEARLRQTSLYRPDLDLVVLDRHNQVAAYSLFWFDPVTATGLVEPMRTEAAHQRRGLARHLLGAGIDRLTGAGARRVKVCYGPGNRAARDLYLGAGFEPDKQTAVFSRRDV
jgi:GNAT superfamily N-acetyltransferase